MLPILEDSEFNLDEIPSDDDDDADIFNTDDSESEKSSDGDTEEDCDIHNYTMEVSDGTEKGQNFLTIISQVVVNGYNSKGNAVQKSFIVKSSPFTEATAKINDLLQDAFIREVYIYVKLFREFRLIQQEKNITDPFKSYPEYFTSSLQNCGESIVLQDLKAYGYKHWNRENPTDFNHAVLLMKEYGRFHALSFAIRDQKPQLFEDIIENTRLSWFHNLNQKVIHDLSKDRVEQALNTLNPIEDKLVYDKFKQFSENMFEVLLECIDVTSASQYDVVNHVDCSLSNFMFKYEDQEDPHKPTSICFLDWQLSYLCSPAIDISTAIFSSTDKKLRDEHYNDLIQEYYNSLCLMLEKLGTDAKDTLPFTVLQQHLKKYSILGLYMSTLLVYVQSMKKEEIPNMANDTTQFRFKLNDFKKYNTRMRDIILDFDAFGYNFSFD
ncbi:hypothetical protein RN001_000492 [Aquatica leii]|uniref:CHK kinase-like domain-containing protein n=1 Tax=Aquatica leii TaxID=1421715 RepID=A0AAN7SC93_9COLE|nr:hypothetical protein RN001_000492 [Aquatica leii]